MLSGELRKFQVRRKDTPHVVADYDTHSRKTTSQLAVGADDERNGRTMKTSTLNSVLRSVVILAVLASGANSLLSAQTGGAVLQNNIQGLWDVDVTIHDCDTGAVLGGFKGLHKYEAGGTAQLVPATNPAALSPHVGVWSQTGRNSYRLAFKMFRFDETGNNIGWNVVRSNVALSSDGTLYTGSGVAEFFDVNGNSLGTSCPTWTGTRFR